jgi:transcriptional regulator with XRE-family HTH domain
LASLSRHSPSLLSSICFLSSDDRKDDESRALTSLGLGQVELSELAGVGLTTLKRIELSDEITGAARTLWKIETGLEATGVEFIPADAEKGPGLRLKHKARGKWIKRAGMQGKSR